MRPLLVLGLLGSMFLTGCSGDDVIDSQRDDQSVDESNNPAILADDKGFGIHFLTTISNYFARDIGTSVYRGASLDGSWKHEYDKDDRLSRSIYYENFPHRVLKEIVYTNYTSDKLEMDLVIKTYNYFYGIKRTYDQNFRLLLYSDLSANKLIRDDDNGYLSFDELNQYGYVTKMGEVTNSGSKLWTTNYNYDEEGNATKYFTTYHQYSIEVASVDYTYTSFGDPDSYYFQNELGASSVVTYYYRGDKTMERLEETFDWGDGDAGTKVIIFTESEAFESEQINYEDGSRLSSAYESDKIIEKNYRSGGEILKEVRTFKLGERHFYCETIEYYDEEGNLDYTEYYDEDGNLIDTVNA